MIYLHTGKMNHNTVYAITDWLKQNVGAGKTTTAVHDWGAGEGWIWFGPRDRDYERDQCRRECCVYFINDPKKETLFRLKWGEYEYG